MTGLLLQHDEHATRPPRLRVCHILHTFSLRPICGADPDPAQQPHGEQACRRANHVGCAECTLVQATRGAV